MTLLLFACYTLALIAAYRLASRLAPTSILHTAAVTIFFWLVNLILPVIYTGMVNLLRPEAMIAAGVLLWGGELVLAGRLRPLPALDMAADRPKWVLLRKVGYGLCAAMYCMSALVILPTMRDFGVILDIDAAWHYLPSMINLVQAGTLNHYDMFMLYFPLSFEMLLAWEMALTRGVLLTVIFHQALMALCLLYAALIVQALLRRHPAHLRDFATQVALFLLISSGALLSVFHSIGKNDLMLAAVTLAAVYYLLRGWEGEQDGRFVVLAGIACGLMVTTKLTSATWVGALTLIHLGMMVRQRQFNIRTLVTTALRAVLPALLIALPWGVRLLFYPTTAPSYAQLNGLGAENAVLRNWATPTFINETLARLPELVLIAIGGVLLLIAARQAGRPRLSVRLGAGLLLIGLVIQAFSRSPESNLSLFVTMVGISAVLLLVRFNSLHVLVLASMMLFTLLPYSGWVYRVTYLIDFTYHHINYRFTPGSYPLFIAATVAVVFAQFAPPTTASTVLRPAGVPKGARPLVVAALALFMVAAVVQYGSSDMRGLLDRYSNYNLRHDEPTPFYHWLYDQVRDARIYSINAPPLLLYGRDFSNQVLYTTAAYSGYYGDQPYRWEEVRQLIDDKQIDYIVVSFNYPELIQAALVPTPDVMAEIDQMRANLRTVFEDEHVTLFATHYAEDVPAPP